MTATHGKDRGRGTGEIGRREGTAVKFGDGAGSSGVP
jgi:hypothetical protein